MVLTATYNGMNSRTQLKASIASTLDFQNDYTYDHMQRQTRVEQVGQSGGNTVASKRLNYSYNAASFVTSIGREYKPSGTWTEVATTAFSYDDINRITGIDHKQGGTSLFTPYSYTFDNADRITDITSQDGTVVYAYDAASQLTSADYSYQTDQSYSYDDNGNWDMSGYSTGTNNRMLSDGVYDYEYDDEGNRVLRTTISDGSYTEYEWDHRNRLTDITNRNSSDAILSTVAYAYDTFDRRISKSYDADGSGSGSAVDTNFVYDVSGTSVLLEFGGSNNLLRRNLWAENVDQLLAVENSSNAISWGLADISRSVRDIINSSGTVQNHIKYDANANVTAESASSVDYLMGALGMVRDEETGLHYAWHRYQGNGHWLSVDRISFLAGDPNLTRVTGNDGINLIDPSGLEEQFPFPVDDFNTEEGRVAYSRWLARAMQRQTMGPPTIEYSDCISGRTVRIYPSGQSQIVGPEVTRSTYDVYFWGWHIERNNYNNPPPTQTRAENQNWERMPDSMNRMHQYGPDGAGNVKYLPPRDGTVPLGQEGVYDRFGILVQDDRNGGTYNYVEPPRPGDGPGTIIGGGIGHFFADMVPYFAFGNGNGQGIPKPIDEALMTKALLHNILMPPGVGASVPGLVNGIVTPVPAGSEAANAYQSMFGSDPDR